MLAGRAPDSSRALPLGAHPSSLPASVSTPNGKTIVVVDDEKSYGDLLSQILVDLLGRPVQSFTHPQAALDALPNLDVGIVVTDYYMPDMTGVEFIRHASQLRPELSFLIITGHPLQLSDEYVYDLTALKAVLPKPFSWTKLAQLIARHWSDPDSRPVPAGSISD
jgi:DNA-binding NtrC family response regulator